MYEKEKKSDFEMALWLLSEEMEAVSTYNYCIANCTDPELANIMRENMAAEKAHASALLRWINKVAPAALM